MNLFAHHALRAGILSAAAEISCNDGVETLVRQALVNGEAELTADGALSATTGVFTGRSVKDKFIVRDALTAEQVWWDNANAMSP